MRFTLRIPDNEGEMLDKHCQKTGRTKTDILREYIRTLPYRSGQPQPLIDTIMSDLQSTGLDAFNGNDRYDISEQVRQVLERHLGGYQ